MDILTKHKHWHVPLLFWVDFRPSGGPQADTCSETGLSSGPQPTGDLA